MSRISIAVTSQVSELSKDLLRFITCGNVDDGKSTLLGRLLLESGAIYDDQLLALEAESARYGTTGDQLDVALLLDGLEDERQQGITIDVAYRYFSTPVRKFIVADTPGHEQFTRNMATGACNADLAILLVDATKGITAQTCRHSILVDLLGITRVVLAVNKMDLVDYDQAVFQRLVSEFQQFAGQLKFASVYAIPLSALEGDNVVNPSGMMDWYVGQTLLEYLNTVDVRAKDASAALRLPVQYVNRPNANFRGYSGTIASGSLVVGQEVMVLPSMKKAKVESIVTMDGEHTSAHSGEAITVTLDRELDITRGDQLVCASEPPRIVQCADAMLVWMSEQALVTSRPYWLKHTTRRTSCEVELVHHRLDINTHRRLPSSTLKLNEIGLCTLRTSLPLMIDPYTDNRTTGSFILVDRLSLETVAAGMFVDQGDSDVRPGNWHSQGMSAERVQWEEVIPAAERQRHLGHPPLTILITGLSGSGKTTLARALERMLFERRCTAVLLDGQIMRQGISRDLTYTAEDRSENLRRAAEIARILNNAGQICIAAFVAPSAWARAKAKQLIGAERVFHVHLSTEVATCRNRDVTGQYQAADRGEIANFPGVSFPYEMPTDADLFLDTTDQPVEQLVHCVQDQLHRRLWLPTDKSMMDG